MKALALTLISSVVLLGCGSSEDAVSASPAEQPVTAAPPANTAPAPTGATPGVATPPVSDSSNSGVEEVAPGQAGSR